MDNASVVSNPEFKPSPWIPMKQVNYRAWRKIWRAEPDESDEILNRGAYFQPYKAKTIPLEQREKNVSSFSKHFPKIDSREIQQSLG